jgi:Amt family ammonium transporter
MVAWLAIEWKRDGHATTLGGASGVVAGLVAITPAAGFGGGLAPIIFGFVASVACYFAIQLKTKYGYDDSLDVVGIHMVGGIVGGVLLGFFADASIGGIDGAFFGDGGLVLSQIIAIVSVMTYSFAVTYGIAKVLDNVMGLRVSSDEELTGLDQTQHAETAYVD